MKFNNIIAVSSLLVLATAQSTTSSAASTTTSQSPEVSCAAKCAATDICCVAGCFKVPCPSDQQANDTVSCVAACPQGSGTPSDTDKYAACQSSCYSSHFFPATMTNAGSTGTGASANTATTTGTGSSSSQTGSSGSHASASGSGTATSSGASSSSTHNAAAVNQLQLGVSAAGLLGFVLAAWAL
ncbi:hypothetical protein IFM61606_05592 [Aspergillus udagawae]|uniref:Uncharacterized protein n=1 Tax=Aspergillus udagawae TaxID=91492 RepID=A0A8H3S7Y6_9EURO|nr:uncharacterized protein Aud_010705 [Aspergillus udagawae]GFF40601.1 hypothetical protein IFM51744_04520 [Aspergillus udagawae]GFF53041.1 hypothetical protein IFM46972_09682 [Aspergillus udagawae]GFF82455.1 hypothetical protein IFM53868_03474 [Aspergillus udagawae]GFG03737.1 hypothetical protein IFM5058_01579 [Aspergillus udagawae]GFG25642.1 hypothetical protein IFM61606_05592 [Aspergillus udagawae]